MIPHTLKLTCRLLRNMLGYTSTQKLKKLPLTMLLPPRGKDVDMRMFVELDHAADTVTRRYITGFFIFFNMVPVVWYSKK